MSEHSPAPWEIEGNAVISRALDGSRRYICLFVNGGTPAQADANRSLIAASPDHATVLRAIAAGLIRWEPFSDGRSGELCGFGLRHGTVLDDFGCPRLTPSLRESIAKAEAREK